MVQVMFLLKFPKGVVCGCKNTFFYFSRSTANKQEKIILCLKEIGSFILNINHSETFPFFVLNSQGGLRRDQKNSAVVKISGQSEIDIVFSLLFLLLEYFADTLSFFNGFQLG